MTEQLQIFLNACQKVCTELDVMFELEQAKRQALLRYDIKEVESITNKQQALVMKLDGVEKRRLQAQIDAGFANSTVTEIILLLDKEDKAVFADVFNNLAIKADCLKISNKTCMDIANSELNLLKIRMPENTQPLSQPGKKGYNNYSRSTFNGTI